MQGFLVSINANSDYHYDREKNSIKGDETYNEDKYTFQL